MPRFVEYNLSGTDIRTTFSPCVVSLTLADGLRARTLTPRPLSPFPTTRWPLSSSSRTAFEIGFARESSRSPTSFRYLDPAVVAAAAASATPTAQQRTHLHLLLHLQSRVRSSRTVVPSPDQSSLVPAFRRPVQSNCLLRTKCVLAVSPGDSPFLGRRRRRQFRFLAARQSSWLLQVSLLIPLPPLARQPKA